MRTGDGSCTHMFHFSVNSDWEIGLLPFKGVSNFFWCFFRVSKVDETVGAGCGGSCFTYPTGTCENELVSKVL